MFITTGPFVSHPKTYIFVPVGKIWLDVPYVGAFVEPGQGQGQKPAPWLDSGRSWGNTLLSTWCWDPWNSCSMWLCVLTVSSDTLGKEVILLELRSHLVMLTWAGNAFLSQCIAFSVDTAMICQVLWWQAPSCSSSWCQGLVGKL